MILASLPIGEWHTGWVRDATYAVVALARMGHLEEARLALDFFLNAFEINPAAGQVQELRQQRRLPDLGRALLRHRRGRGRHRTRTARTSRPTAGGSCCGRRASTSRPPATSRGSTSRRSAARVWDALINGIAKPIEAQPRAAQRHHGQGLEHLGGARGEEAPLRVHDAHRRARPLRHGRHREEGATRPTSRSTRISPKKVREGFLAAFVDPQGALAGSLEGLSQGKYIDGAVAEAFTWNVLQDWKGETAKATLDLLNKLKVDSGGFKRNDDGLSSYDNNEWILVDLRIANAMRRAGRDDEGRRHRRPRRREGRRELLSRPRALQRHGAAPARPATTPARSRWSATAAAPSRSRCSIGRASSRPNDCGDGKGATLPKVSCCGDLDQSRRRPGRRRRRRGRRPQRRRARRIEGPVRRSVPLRARSEAGIPPIGPRAASSPRPRCLLVAPRPAPTAMTEAAPLALELVAIEKSFGGVHALRGAELAARPGEILGLCGENGAGKSTLLKVLSGVYPATSYGGTVRVRGEERRFMTTRDAEHAGIAIVHQELMLVPELSVAANLALGREQGGGTVFGLVDDDAIEARARELLAKFGVERDIDPRAPVGILGIGLQQVVEIVRALSQDAKILILDEPTAALTGKETDRLMEWLRGLRDAGTTCIYVSHRMDEIFTICDRITVLRDGKTVGTVAREARRAPTRSSR